MAEFTHLHVHTQYSLLDGAIRVKDLFPRIRERGMDTVAVTDHGNMFGAIDVYTEAKANEMRVPRDVRDGYRYNRSSTPLTPTCADLTGGEPMAQFTRSSLTSAALLLSSLALVACGDDGGGVTLDAAIDAPVPPCTVSTTNFGTKELSGRATFRPGAMAASPIDDVLELNALLEPAPPADAIAIILYANYGAFAGRAITPGTYPITGAELDFETCGVCVLLATNSTAAGYDDDYMATGGMVTITAAGSAVGQSLVGSVRDVTFHHVTIDVESGATTPVADDCETRLMIGYFTATLIGDQ